MTFEEFANKILQLIPDDIKEHINFKPYNSIIVSSHYTAPEIMWERKVELCSFLQKHCPINDPPLEWQSKILDLIQTIKF
jgi:hypothetical protein